jgi:hypothetical protein
MIDPEEKYGCRLTALENNVQRRTPRGEENIWVPNHKYEDTIRMDLKEIGCDSLVWMQLGQDGIR